MPSRPVAILTATLIGILYTLVPVGRWRQLGNGSRPAWSRRSPRPGSTWALMVSTDALLGAVIGVAVSVAAYRLFVPNEIFPITYKRGRSAHLDVGGRRGDPSSAGRPAQAVDRAEVEPFGLSGSAGSTPLRIQVQDGAGTTRYVFGKLYAKSHLPCRPLLQARPGAAVRAAGGMRSCSTPSSGLSSRKTTRWR